MIINKKPSLNYEGFNVNKLLRQSMVEVNNVNNKQFSKSSGVLKKVIHEQNNKKNEFVFDNNDFPPLGK
jgi:hypothetical protein